jgi:hypothetical protein
LDGTYAAIGTLAPACLPQSSFAGEYIGIRIELQATGGCRHEVHTRPPFQVFTDSAAALGGITTVLLRGWVDHRRPWGGLWGDSVNSQLQPPFAPSSVSFQKIKAHCTLTSSLPRDEQISIVGSLVADRIADRVLADYVYPATATTKPPTRKH